MSPCETVDTLYIDIVPKETKQQTQEKAAPQEKKKKKKEKKKKEKKKKEKKKNTTETTQEETENSLEPSLPEGIKTKSFQIPGSRYNQKKENQEE